MSLPTIKLCQACKQYDDCKDKENLQQDFIDWEKYKKIFMSSSCTARCDIILDVEEKVHFIELKSKDFFDESRASGGDFISNIYKKLYNKIESTFNEYNDNVSSTKDKKNIYSIVFSKYAVKWNNVGQDIPASLIKDMLNRRVFPRFNEFNHIRRTFSLDGIDVFLKAIECSEVEEHLIQN